MYVLQKTWRRSGKTSGLPTRLLNMSSGDTASDPHLASTLKKSIMDVLCGAYSLLCEHGWCQKRIRTPDGRMCAAEALARAGGGDSRAVSRARHRLWSHACGMPNWQKPPTVEAANDYSCHTREHLFGWFERAIIAEAKAAA